MSAGQDYLLLDNSTTAQGVLGPKCVAPLIQQITGDTPSVTAYDAATGAQVELPTADAVIFTPTAGPSSPNAGKVCKITYYNGGARFTSIIGRTFVHLGTYDATLIGTLLSFELFRDVRNGRIWAMPVELVTEYVISNTFITAPGGTVLITGVLPWENFIGTVLSFDQDGVARVQVGRDTILVDPLGNPGSASTLITMDLQQPIDVSFEGWVWADGTTPNSTQLAFGTTVFFSSDIFPRFGNHNGVLRQNLYGKTLFTVVGSALDEQTGTLAVLLIQRADDNGPYAQTFAVGSGYLLPYSGGELSGFASTPNQTTTGA